MLISKQQSHKIFAFFILLLSIALVAVALPRFRASINQIPVKRAIDKLVKHKILTDKKLDKLIKISESSIDIWDSNFYWSDLRALLNQKSKLVGFYSKEGQELLQQAQLATEHSLSRSPADSYLWYRLARLKAMQNSEAGDIVMTLRMSMMLGPNELHIVIPRLQLCFFYFKQFKQADFGLLRSQTLLVWRVAKRPFSIILKKHPGFFKSVELLLQKQYPETLQKMVLIIDKTS